MADGFKICPICKTANHPQAAICVTCGASLAQVAVTHTRASTQPKPDYDFGYGETDLLENTLAGRARVGLIISTAVTLGIIASLVFVAWLNREALIADPQSSAPSVPTFTQAMLVPFATVTEGPPTATHTFTPAPTDTPTITPTPAPCVQRIVAGGSLIGAITNCGHRSLDVLPTVLALNNIKDAGQVRVGQEITIPWPTPTPDPNAKPTATQEARRDNRLQLASSNPLALDMSIDPFAPTATATLPAGVMWHRVAPGENIITVAIAYNANAKVLSELNPEVDFARCEFGERFGGPECIVQLFAGQMLRVPAPTPTPTLSPTPDPNATATPTPTATFNMPSVISPNDRQFFNANELIALRWIPSATLRQNESYRVDLENVTTGERHVALTTDIVFLVPLEWRGKENRRFEYRWQVSIINQNTPEERSHPTQPRTFFWQGATE